VDSVVLVGGATKLSIVRNFVGRLFGLIPATTINPDEAVALGTAVQAAMKERNEAIKELLLTDVCPYTLGTEVAYVRENGMIQTGNFMPIIERNTVIPTSRVERVYTLHDGQKMVQVDILQGESRNVKDNIFLGSLDIPLPPGPAGKESVDIRYTYDINGILEAEVTAVSTGEQKVVVIEKNPGTMTDEDIKRCLAQLENLKIHPRDRDEYRYLIERGERLYREHTGDLRRQIGEAMSSFDEVLDGQDRKEIDEAAAELREFFREIDV
jgi:molecular chaperone HscC